MAGPDGTDYLSEEQAQALWRRAAQLQAESADRRDDRTHRLASGESAPDAIHVSDVEQAGVEAGIAPEFIRLARAETIADGSKPMSSRWERATTWLVGSDRRLIEITRTIRAEPRRVLEAIGRVFPANPYYLNLIETLGDPAAGGVMVFDVTRRSVENATSFTWDMLLADLKQVLVMLRPSVDTEGATDVVLVSSLNYARKLNLGVGGTFLGVLGAGGGAAGTAIGVGALGLGALAVLPGAAAAAGIGWLCVKSYRPMFRWGLNRGTRALEGLMRAIDLRLRTGGVIPHASPTDDPSP